MFTDLKKEIIGNQFLQKEDQMTKVPFTVDQLLKLAKIGSDKIVADYRSGGEIWHWEGILPGSESETFEEIEQELRKKFPDGVIVDDIA